MTHASSKRGQVVAHRGCFANLLALVGASMDPSLRGDDDLLHPFALLRETRPSRNTCPPPDASHRRRQRLLYLQRTRVVRAPHHRKTVARSEEHTSELQSLMRISYAVFCLKN